jgi:hypothetical protein
MALTIDAPVASAIDQLTALQLAKQQVGLRFGEAYTVGKGQQLPNGNWRFLIQFHSAALARPLTCATIQVDSQQRLALPLTKAQVQEAQERVQLALQEAQGEPCVADETLSLLAAQRVANRYLSDNVGFFFTATEGILIPVMPPVWQFLIQFRLPQSGNIGIFGTLDVDTQTGAVIPLPQTQILTIQRRANAIARSQTHQTAA